MKQHVQSRLSHVCRYHYAGLDGNDDGTSLLAWLRKDKPGLFNVHGLCHQHDLGIKFAIKRCTWTEQWLDHVKACYNFFSKSTMRKSRLKQLHEDMQRVGDNVTWRFVYIKYHCPHRWFGMKSSLKSILREQIPLVAYADELEAEGVLPDRGNPQDPPALEAAASRLLPFDDEEEARVNEDTFYQWGDDPWDLKMTTPPRRDTSVLSESRRLRLDTGRAQRWKNLPDGVGKNKCKLLSERVGLTTEMFGLDAVMADALEPYSVLMERLQIQNVPIAHNVRKWVCEFFRSTNAMFLVSDAPFGNCFKEWSDIWHPPAELEKQVRNMGRQFVFYFLQNMRHRLKPYWRLFLACETINPVAPYRTSPEAWVGVMDLCRRVGMSEHRSRACVRQLKMQKDQTGDWSLPEIKICSRNLLRYYHDRFASDEAAVKTPDFPIANTFATLVFSIHVASAVIETYFSKTKYSKNQYRSRMSDDLASAILHLQQLRGYRHDEILEDSRELTIELQQALDYVQNSLQDLRKKYIDRRIKKPFMDETLGQVRDYGGVVTGVDFCAADGCYLFKINYDSDSDDEDMEHWELKNYLES